MNLESKLPPWDAAAYFRQPVEVVVQMGANAVQAAPGDPMRMVLLFTAPTVGTTIRVSTKPLSSMAFGGILVPGTVSPFVLTWDDYGPLVQQPWYAIGTMGAPLTVIMQSMSQWPGTVPAGQENIIVKADRGDYRGKYSAYRQPPRRSRIYGYRWMKV